MAPFEGKFFSSSSVFFFWAGSLCLSFCIPGLEIASSVAQTLVSWLNVLMLGVCRYKSGPPAPGDAPMNFFDVAGGRFVPHLPICDFLVSKSLTNATHVLFAVCFGCFRASHGAHRVGAHAVRRWQAKGHQGQEIRLHDPVSLPCWGKLCFDPVFVFCFTLWVKLWRFLGAGMLVASSPPPPPELTRGAASCR